MTCRLDAVCVLALDPWGLGRFWAGLLDRELVDDPHGGPVLLPGDGTAFALRFLPTREPKTGQNPLHLDLTSSSAADQQRTVARALALGARHADVGQGPDEPHVVLADPEGDEFCVIEPGNQFLTGCGRVGALACDGTRRVGHFWSAALDWPLVWDQDEETAIQSPHGGPKISWGGPPLMPGTGRNRLHLSLAPPAHGDPQAELDRLVALGATLVGSGLEGSGATVLADPDGNEFWVLGARRHRVGRGSRTIR